jgi:hypothetical protein
LPNQVYVEKGIVVMEVVVEEGVEVVLNPLQVHLQGKLSQHDLGEELTK